MTDSNHRTSNFPLGPTIGICFAQPHVFVTHRSLSASISPLRCRKKAFSPLNPTTNSCLELTCSVKESGKTRLTEPLISTREDHPSASSAVAMASIVHKSPPLAMQVRFDGDVPVAHIDGFSKTRYPRWLLLACLAAGLWLLRRIVISKYLRKPYSRDNLYADIASFYDFRSAAWESVWGEHMHHGLYDKVADKDDDGRVYTVRGAEAQIRTMSELLRLARSCGASILPGTRGPRILDVGCGIGGASRYLARNFGSTARVDGITLSPIQAARATELNQEQKLGTQVKIGVQNAHATNFDSEWFDLVWSLESAEHMDDKRGFIEECTRVLRPGAPFVMLAWCIRESDPPLGLSERFAIRKIMEQYCLPRLSPPSEYQTEMIRAGLVDVSVDDWTDRAAPFWGEVARSTIFNPKGIAALFKYGWPLLRSAVAMRHVIKGIELGAFRLVAFSGRKGLEVEPEKQKVSLSCRETATWKQG